MPWSSSGFEGGVHLGVRLGGGIYLGVDLGGGFCPAGGEPDEDAGAGFRLGRVGAVGAEATIRPCRAMVSGLLTALIDVIVATVGKGEEPAGGRFLLSASCRRRLTRGGWRFREVTRRGPGRASAHPTRHIPNGRGTPRSGCRHRDHLIVGVATVVRRSTS